MKRDATVAETKKRKRHRLSEGHNHAWYSVVERLRTWIIEQRFEIPRYSLETLDDLQKRWLA